VTGHLMLSGARSVLLELLDDGLLLCVGGCETMLDCDLNNLGDVSKVFLVRVVKFGRIAQLVHHLKVMV
jgi:hypothetical protein